MLIFRGESYICVLFVFSAKRRLTPTELLFEVPSLRVSSLNAVNPLRNRSISVQNKSRNRWTSRVRPKQRFCEPCRNWYPPWTPWCQLNLSQTIFVGNFRLESAILHWICYNPISSKRKTSHRIASKSTLKVAKLHLCPTDVGCKIATGTRGITLRGTFSMSHFQPNGAIGSRAM